MNNIIEHWSEYYTFYYKISFLVKEKMNRRYTIFLADECTLEQYANVLSGRSAIGHDKYGRVLFLQVDGRTLQIGFVLI